MQGQTRFVQGQELIIKTTLGPFIRTPCINGTKSVFTPYSTQGQLKPRLILAEGIWDGLIQAAAYLGRESVRINSLKRCPRLAEAVNDCCACSVFSYTPSRPRDARCSGGKIGTLRSIFKLRKNNKISSLLVYVLHKTRN